MEYPSGKKMTETLHHALRAMMQFPVIFFFQMDTPSTSKKKKSFLKEIVDKNPFLLLETAQIFKPHINISLHPNVTSFTTSPSFHALSSCKGK
jgi:hypothetical protein